VENQCGKFEAPLSSFPIRARMSAIPSTPIILALEGNIGAGKTTLLRYIQENHHDIQLIDEPVDTWETMKTPDGKNILQHFYGDMERWAYTFQNTALLTRIENIQRAIDKHPNARLFLMERSYLTDRYVFAKILHEDKKMNDMELDIYTRWYDHFTSKYPIHSILWLNTDVDTCVERIHKRARPGEENIPRDYLARLDKAHRDWLEVDSCVHEVITLTKDMTVEEIGNKFIKPLCKKFE
jgi:deoxyadenosine/deoxycytidine kinase